MRQTEIQLLVFDSAEQRGLRNFLTRTLRDLVTYRYAIGNFISSTLRARYRRSALGFLWTLLNPLFTMAILSVVFSTIFHNSLRNFSIYIFSGLLPWTLISNSMTVGSTSIINGEGYLKKVYVPKFLFPLVTVGVEVTNFLLSLVSLFVVAVLLGARISWGLLALPPALLLTAVFILGWVLVVSILTVYFRDLSHITQIVFTALFYVTPIVYPIDLIAHSTLLKTAISWNPLYYFVELFHRIIYQAQTPDLSLWVICSGLTVLSLFFGLLVFAWKEHDLIYRL